MVLLQLYWSFFKIGLFSIGGGYASLPLIQKEVVDLHQWITMTEFTDIITISQMTPGPIAINTSTFVGTQIGGLLGAIVATLGCVSPSFIIVLFLAHIYVKYRNLDTVSNIGDKYGVSRPTIARLLRIDTLIFELKTRIDDDEIDLSINYISVIFFIVGMFFLRKYKSSPIYVMLGCGVAGAIIYNI